MFVLYNCGHVYRISIIIDQYCTDCIDFYCGTSTKHRLFHFLLLADTHLQQNPQTEKQLQRRAQLLKRVSVVPLATLQRARAATGAIIVNDWWLLSNLPNCRVLDLRALTGTAVLPTEVRAFVLHRDRMHDPSYAGTQRQLVLQPIIINQVNRLIYIVTAERSLQTTLKNI